MSFLQLASRYLQIYLLICVFSRCTVSHPCPDDLSVRLEEGKYEKRGVHIWFNGVWFPPESYWQDNDGVYRLCVCSVLTCWRKCCPEGEAFIFNSVSSRWECAPPNSIIRHPFNPPGFNLQEENGMNYILTGSPPCETYRYTAPNDRFKILRNASLVTYQSDNPDRNFTYDVSHYCWEAIIDDNQPGKFLPHLCLPPPCDQSNEPVTDKSEPPTEQTEPGTDQTELVTDQSKLVTDQAEPSFTSTEPQQPQPPSPTKETQSLTRTPAHNYSQLISIAFLAVTLVVFACSEPQWSYRCVLYFLTSLLFFFACKAFDLLQPLGPLSDRACAFLALTVEFFFLAAYFWMSVLCIKTWWMFSDWDGLRNAMQNISKVWKNATCLAFAWGIPFIICSFTITVGLKLGLFTEEDCQNTVCFTRKIRSIELLYIVLAGALMIINVILFVSAVIGNASRYYSRQHLERFALCLKLFVIMGICLIGQMVSWYLDSDPNNGYIFIAYICSILTCSLLFLLFVCNQKRIYHITGRLCPTVKLPFIVQLAPGPTEREIYIALRTEEVNDLEEVTVR